MYLTKSIRWASSIFLVLILFLAGCGYTNGARLPDGVRTIAVPTFRNEIPRDSNFTYEPGVEAIVTNAILQRLNFDGNLRIVSADKADAVLDGAITSYDQESIRYEERDEVKEYRLFLGVTLSFINQKTGAVLWKESNFTGRTEFLRTGQRATTERAALLGAAEDLAKKVVDRIVEDW